MIKDSSMRKEIPKNDRFWRENLFDLGERRGGASCTLIVPEEATLETSPDRVEGQNSQLLFRGVENPCPVPFIRAIFGSQVTNIHGLQQRLWKTSSRFPFFFPRSNIQCRISEAKKPRFSNRSCSHLNMADSFRFEIFDRTFFELRNRFSRRACNVEYKSRDARKCLLSEVEQLFCSFFVDRDCSFTDSTGRRRHYNIRARFTGRNLSVEWKARNGRGNAMVN